MNQSLTENRNAATTGRRANTQTRSPQPSYSKSNIGTGTSKSSHRSQPSSQLEPEKPPGRYHAGVRALRSLALPRPNPHISGEQNCGLGGRYNAGVRAPRSQEEPS